MVAGCAQIVSDDQVVLYDHIVVVVYTVILPDYYDHTVMAADLDYCNQTVMVAYCCDQTVMAAYCCDQAVMAFDYCDQIATMTDFCDQIVMVVDQTVMAAYYCN